MAKRESTDGARVVAEWVRSQQQPPRTYYSTYEADLAHRIDAALRAAEERMRERAAREIAACQHDWDYENEIARNVRAVLVNLEAAIRRLDDEEWGRG